MRLLQRITLGILTQALVLLVGGFSTTWAATSHVATTAAAQPAIYSLSGRVQSNQGAPLPGVVVLVKGTNNVATTNSAGEFLVAAENTEIVLEFSCMGYQTRLLAVQERAPVAVTLYPVGVAIPVTATDASTPKSDPALVTADVMPAFPGGPTAYRNFLLQNAKYPDEAKRQGLSGAVYVSFVVDEKGRIQDAQVLKGCGASLDQEALRLIRIMPWWTPGLLNNEPVRVACTLRISFGLEQR